MSCIGFLKRIGLLQHFSRDELLEAQSDNAIVEFERAADLVQKQSLTVEASNARLRESIRKSMSSSAFGTLEHEMQVLHDRRQQRARRAL